MNSGPVVCVSGKVLLMLYRRLGVVERELATMAESLHTEKDGWACGPKLYAWPC